MVSILGTMAAGVAHTVLGIPFRVEKTLSIHSIYAKRSEMFYWATVLATFALGTPLGDMTATTLHLGYFFSGVMFAIFVCDPGLCYWLFGMNAVFSFWFSYVLTRPLGASFADWAGKSPSVGGLGLGDGLVSGVLIILIVFFVSYLAITRKDVKALKNDRQENSSRLKLTRN